MKKRMRDNMAIKDEINVTSTLTPEMDRKFRQVSHDIGISRAKIIRELVEGYVTNHHIYTREK